MSNATSDHDPSFLGDLEREVLQLIWANGPSTAEAVREKLGKTLKESTVRTVLRRLEEKGYLKHEVENRTFIYREAEGRHRVAARAVKHIVDWICNGSVEELLAGMVDTKAIDHKQLQRLTEKIAKAKKDGNNVGRIAGSCGVHIGFGDRRGRLLENGARAEYPSTAHRMDVVLSAGLSMPLLMRWTTIAVPAAPSTPLWIAPPAQVFFAAEAGRSAIRQDPFPVNWDTIFSGGYLLIAGLLVGRLMIGLLLTWRIVSRATRPILPDNHNSFGIVADSISMIGDDAALVLRDKIRGDYIWFRRDSKNYYITDPSTVQRAIEMFKPQEELGRQQAQLGDEQAKLGEEQAKLGEQQARVAVAVPDMSRDIDALRRRFAASAGEELRQDELGDLQAELADLQTRVGELQERAGRDQATLGIRQASLGARQASLGARQAVLGERQAQLTAQASGAIRSLIDGAIGKGYAREVQ
jgi:BlaI family transcriptional regulator, penicillinase repressor